MAREARTLDGQIVSVYCHQSHISPINHIQLKQ